MTDRTRGAYDRWAQSYDEDPNPQTALEEPHVLEALAARPAGWFLDAACGTGRYLARLPDGRQEAVGCDFSWPMLRRARERVPGVPLLLADLRAPMPFRASSFSAVLCAQTLKHLPDLGPALRQFGRVLMDGGLLVFSVTHPGMTWEGYEMAAPPEFILSEEADIFHHTEAAYREALQASGFAVARWRSIEVGESIRSYLTAGSYAVVRGRPQVLLVEAAKRG